MSDERKPTELGTVSRRLQASHHYIADILNVQEPMDVVSFFTGPVMDSRSRRLPFCLPSSRSSYASAPSASSSVLGAGSLYSSREPTSTSERFPRVSAAFKADQQASSHLLSSSRDFSSSDGRPSSWKLPPPRTSGLTPSTTSYDRPWAESSLSSRNRLTQAAPWCGPRSGVLSTNDDGDSKRAKVTYGGRGLVSRTSSPSLTGSSYSSSGLGSLRGSHDMQRAESSWSSCRQLSQPPVSLWKPLSSRRELEDELGAAGRRERQPPGAASSLYRSDGVSSAYAQGARPKDSAYSSSFSAAAASPGRYVSSYRTSEFDRSRLLSGSSTAPRRSGPSPVATASPWHSRPEAPPPPPPDPVPDGGDLDGRRSTRSLLSHLFSRRTGVRCHDDAADSNDGGVVSSEGGDSGGSQASGRRGADAPLVQEDACCQDRMWERESESDEGGSTSSSSSSSSSWFSSSHRAPPLLSRLRRHASTTSGQGVGYSRPPRRWDNVEQKASQQEDGEGEGEGAVGVDASGRPASRRQDVTRSPDHREGVCAVPGGGGDMARDEEKLRLIKEKLLLEDSDDDDGDSCRICQMGAESASNPLIQPCRCTGSLQYVHQDCIKQWLCSKFRSGTTLEEISTCELCKEKLQLNIDNFNIQELYRTHIQSKYDEFISSGLCLIVLLHVCEQRFSDVLGAVDAGFFNVGRVVPEHLEHLGGDSDSEDVDDTRPSIEFSDLDDDLEDGY